MSPETLKCRDIYVYVFPIQAEVGASGYTGWEHAIKNRHTVKRNVCVRGLCKMKPSREKKVFFKNKNP